MTTTTNSMAMGYVCQRLAWSISDGFIRLFASFQRRFFLFWGLVINPVTPGRNPVTESNRTMVSGTSLSFRFCGLTS